MASLWGIKITYSDSMDVIIQLICCRTGYAHSLSVLSYDVAFCLQWMIEDLQQINDLHYNVCIIMLDESLYPITCTLPECYI